MMSENTTNDNLNVYRLLYKTREETEEQEEIKPWYIHVPYMTFLVLFSILFPIIGLFFYIIWKNDRPKDAKWPGIGTLLGFIINFGIGALQQFGSLIF